jgi:membrane-bound lytic murein transglycosylase D
MPHEIVQRARVRTNPGKCEIVRAPPIAVCNRLKMGTITVRVRRRASRIAALSALLCAAACGVLAAAAAPAEAVDEESNPFPRPPELEPDVRFWIRVYTEVTTDGGLLHDSWNLGLVYEVMRFEPDMSPPARERAIAAAKVHYAALLRRFAAGDRENLSTHELRILHAFGANATAGDFTSAIDRIRFQLGQADRFHEGLIRAEVLERRIAETLRKNGVPTEIAALPHVESSFNAFAYSRVGAAGLWQFMPKTARRYMRVDDLVDERLDPYRATEAAANLMLYNYRLVGTWPLAVTAYNHGPGGLRRAQDELGSSDIAVIVKRYQGATFGFASRNFYVAFLAALEVDRNADKFFGPITRLPDPENMTVELPDYIAVETAAKAFKVDMGALRVLNPALRPPIWSGARLVPRGYALRIPGKWSAGDILAAWDRVPAGQRYLAQRGDSIYRVRHAETLAAVARRTGVPLARLLAANAWTAAPELQKGQVVRLPPPPTRADRGDLQIAALSAVPAAAAVTLAPIETPPTAAPEPAAAAPAPPARAPTAPAPPIGTQAERRPALLPAATPSGNSDTTDYAVAKGDTVTVQAGETLGSLADWSETNADELRKLNHLRKGAMIGLGHKIKLDLSRIGAEQFEARRHAYHRELQETYFAAHRIAATENYTIKRGDSLWTIAHSHGDLPVWLVTQYNPDADFNAMRPGTSISLPEVEPINRQ